MKRLLPSMIAAAALAVVTACSADETVTGGIVAIDDASCRARRIV